MTRIIAGAAGGTGIAVPPTGTRPTSDRVREALFSALDAADLLEGARVADLYAGSGALGLEAASRGALSVDLVENASGAASVIRRNADLVTRPAGVRAVVRVHRTAVATFLRGTARGPYDLVFLDPPYDLPEAELTEALGALAPHVTAEAVVIVERARRSPEPAWADAGLELLRSRSYGDTVTWWAQPRAESQSR